VVAQGTDRLPKNDGNEDEATFVMAEIDLDWEERVREDMPLWEQRREDVYPIL
jgi:predicted amidohydrolase